MEGLDGFDYSLVRESLLKAGINYRHPSDNNTEQGKHVSSSHQAEEEKTGPQWKKKCTMKSRILKNVAAMCPTSSGVVEGGC